MLRGDVSWDPRGNWFGLCTPGELSRCPLCLRDTLPWPGYGAGSKSLSLEQPQGRMWGEPSMCWGPGGASHLLTACPTAPEPGQQVCGAEESRCGRGSCLAWHRFCDGTDDCGDGSDEDARQCSEHPWPWRGGPAHRPPDRTEGLRVCPGGAKPGRGAGRGHPSSAPRLCSQRGKITLRVLWRGGISPAHCRDLLVGGRAGTPHPWVTLLSLLPHRVLHPLLL